MQFDLSSIPVGAIIHGATLNMEATAVGGLLNVDVYQVPGELGRRNCQRDG